MDHQPSRAGQPKRTIIRQIANGTASRSYRKPSPSRVRLRAHPGAEEQVPILRRSEGHRTGFGRPRQTPGRLAVDRLLGRCLMDFNQVVAALNLGPDDVRWLVATRQLKEIKLCGKVRYDSRDVSSLVETYKRTQGKGN